MTTLIEFLESRLAEDEAIAQASIADDQGDDGGLEYEYLTSGRIQRPRFGEPLAKLVTTFAVPRRVLREVAAKRAIIAEHQETGTAIWWPDDESIEFEYCIRCTHDPYHPDESESRPAPCPTLKALAAVYSDHEAYRDEWRP